MPKELKKAIFKWLYDNENAWQRVNACHTEFYNYIFDTTGNYLIGGETVANFVSETDKLIYGQN